MKSKTLKLISSQLRVIREQDDMGVDPSMADPNAAQAPPEAAAPPEPTEEMPLTSQAEEKYIKDLVDAALFEPSAEEARTLLNLQSVMEMKRFKNAREEILPIVLSMISKETQSSDLRSNLDEIS